LVKRKALEMENSRLKEELAKALEQSESRLDMSERNRARLEAVAGELDELRVAHRRNVRILEQERVDNSLNRQKAEREKENAEYWRTKFKRAEHFREDAVRRLGESSGKLIEGDARLKAIKSDLEREKADLRKEFFRMADDAEAREALIDALTDRISRLTAHINGEDDE